MKEEEQLKIKCLKQSATRTSVEQVADAGPNFKNVKKCKVYTKPSSQYKPDCFSIGKKIETT